MNPYNPPAQPCESSDILPLRRVRDRFAICAGALGACLPFLYGAWLVYSVWSQTASPPGYALDGTPAFVGFVIILLGCPLVGIIFATIGGTVGHIRDVIVLRRYMAMLDRSSRVDALR